MVAKVAKIIVGVDLIVPNSGPHVMMSVPH